METDLNRVKKLAKKKANENRHVGYVRGMQNSMRDRTGLPGENEAAWSARERCSVHPYDSGQ